MSRRKLASGVRGVGIARVFWGGVTRSCGMTAGAVERGPETCTPFRVLGAGDETLLTPTGQSLPFGHS